MQLRAQLLTLLHICITATTSSSVSSLRAISSTTLSISEFGITLAAGRSENIRSELVLLCLLSHYCSIIKTCLLLLPVPALSEDGDLDRPLDASFFHPPLNSKLTKVFERCRVLFSCGSFPFCFFSFFCSISVIQDQQCVGYANEGTVPLSSNTIKVLLVSMLLTGNGCLTKWRACL